MNRQSALTGTGLIERRAFLGSASLGTIALAALLADERQATAAEPLRPEWSAERPHAPRPPHFAAKAKHVLVIFCSGALSHLDTWDYKPELIKRHGQPLPGGEKLVTFQGENGNVTRSPWEFQARAASAAR